MLPDKSYCIYPIDNPLLLKYSVIVLRNRCAPPMKDSSRKGDRKERVLTSKISDLPKDELSDDLSLFILKRR